MLKKTNESMEKTLFKNHVHSIGYTPLLDGLEMMNPNSRTDQVK